LYEDGYDAFIAYYRDSAYDFAEHLKKSMEKIGSNVFLDTHDIPKEITKEEFQWRVHRDQAINSSKKFFVILTRGFDNSSEIKSELSQAIENDTPMYFFKHKSLPWDISIELNRREFNFGKCNLQEFENKYDLVRLVLEIINKKKKSVIDKTYTFSDNFEEESIGNVPSKWSVLRQSGEVFVQNGVSMEGISNFLVISSPYGSNDNISLILPKLRNLSLSYEFRQDYFRGRRVGAGINLFSDSTQAIWFGIRLGALYYFNEIDRYKPITQIEIGNWYNVHLDIDCPSNSCNVLLNGDEVVSNINFRNYVEYINRLSTSNWINQENWQTCLDNIKIEGEKI
jgi:hypothetical protein